MTRARQDIIDTLDNTNFFAVGDYSVQNIYNLIWSKMHETQSALMLEETRAGVLNRFNWRVLTDSHLQDVIYELEGATDD